MVMLDTDILIYVQRGNTKAAMLVDNHENKHISIITYMELLQCANSKLQHRYTKDFLNDFDFKIIPVSENIGHRAAIYIEEYSLKNSVRVGDALIAATAVDRNLQLVTANKKHFKDINELNLKIFKP